MNRRSSTAYAESNGPFTLKASFSHDSAPTWNAASTFYKNTGSMRSSACNTASA